MASITAPLKSLPLAASSSSTTHLTYTLLTRALSFRLSPSTSYSSQPSSSSQSSSSSSASSSQTLSTASPFSWPSFLPSLPSLASLLELLPPIVLAVPKHKVTHSRKSMRSANKGLKNKTNLTHCEACGTLKLAHNLCPTCFSQISRRWKKEARGELPSSQSPTGSA